ncbi:MAG TPA: HNH endonuclease signature motif containing protein, partial [Streptosporangiaceae bacterium]|nr:HNH endonuclease signature motif containing protein [Streptosporangiaceae bacterium]
HDPGQRERLQAAAARAAAEAPFGDVLAQAIALLSGPAGRAAWLRRRAAGIPVATISLPLDIAATFDTIPVHLRRAVRKRDKHCRFPGCDLPAAGCEVHHILPRKDGGRHALSNMALLCRFHHLVAIHRWGWQFTLHPDGTTTAVSPDGTKTLHSHAPPSAA